MPPDRPMKIPKSVIDLIWPLTLSPRLKLSLKSFHGFDWHCLMPERDTTTLFVDVQHHDFHFLADVHDLGGFTFLLVQSISDTCTRPSTPSSISTKQP